MKNKQTNKPSNSWLCSPDCAREPRGPGQALGFCTDLNCPCPGPEGSAPLSQRVTDLAPFTEETGSACLAKLRVTSGIICGVWHLLGRLSGRWKEGGPQGPRAVCGAALRAPGRPGNEGGAQTPPSGPSPSGRRGGPGACGGAAAPNGPSRATGSEGVGVHPAEGQPRWASLWARGRAPAHACARTHAHVPARTHARTRTHVPQSSRPKQAKRVSPSALQWDQVLIGTEAWSRDGPMALAALAGSPRAQPSRTGVFLKDCYLVPVRPPVSSISRAYP